MSTLGEHRGNGIRFDMHLSAPNGGVAQMLCRPEGQWVSWSEYDKLKVEVERLRKAGDAMLLALWLGVNEYSKEQKEKAEEEWNAANREQGCLVNPIKVAQYLPKPPAKEGKPSV